MEVTNMTRPLSFEITLPRPFDAAVQEVTEALKKEGFGVLTRIDVKATLREKLGADFRPYVILGACNPPLAHKALSHDARAGLVLPCNVVVEAEDAARSTVRIGNPDAFLGIGGFEQDPVLQDVAGEARDRLERVAKALGGV
jgi:uncharacterized protein (DUF302 family)